MKGDEYTIDSIWIPEIQIRQSRKGYRFALDAVLLAHFIELFPDEAALEIGSGNGIIPILLSHLKHFYKITGIEIQPALAQLSMKNIELNRVQNVAIIQADAKDLNTFIRSNSIDLIYSNPPYRKTGSGRLNPSEEKAIARHEIKLRLEDIFLAAGEFLKPDGRLTLILPEFREQDFLKLCREHSFFVNKSRHVHSFENSSPVFFLATASRKNFAETLPPLIIYDSAGEYSQAMKKMLKRSDAGGSD